jgi:acyl-CoA carboxylase subunit beta
MESLPDIPAWESITRSRRAERPGVRMLLRLGATDVVPLHGTGRGERDRAERAAWLVRSPVAFPSW